MNRISLTILLVFCIAGALTYAASVTDGGLKRRSAGESCKFQWIVTGAFMSYAINSLANGNPTPLGFNTNHISDQSTGVITLYIWNIQMSDAGLYQLIVLTGSSDYLYSIATLFVYAVPHSSVAIISGGNPAKEGDNIEVQCTVTSYSFPVANQPKIYYFWTINNVSFQNISSGPAITMNGDVLPQYLIKNDGGTFVIISAQAFDNHIYCQAQEEESPYRSVYPKDHLPFELHYRPYTFSFNPPSKKFTSNPYTGTITVFSFSANPKSISYTNWIFISTSGGIYEIPVNDTTINSGYFTLSSNSSNFYGNYSITLTNSIGSRTETFRAIPAGPPDAPSQFTVEYVTHSIISLKWRCMWNNGFPEIVFLRLIEVSRNIEIDTQAISPNTDCFDTLFSTIFQKNLLPNTPYHVIIWSSNKLGSSNSQTLMMQTNLISSLKVSCQDISITGSQATINVLASFYNVVWLNVTCCVEFTAECITQSYTLMTPVNQIVVDDIPVRDGYVFDFILFGDNFYNYLYLLAVVKGVHVSRTSSFNLACTCNDQTNPKVNTSAPTTATNVLGVFFGGVLLAFGICLGILIWKCRHQVSGYIRRCSSTTCRTSYSSSSSSDSIGSSQHESRANSTVNRNERHYVEPLSSVCSSENESGVSSSNSRNPTSQYARVSTSASSGSVHNPSVEGRTRSGRQSLNQYTRSSGHRVTSLTDRIG